MVVLGPFIANFCWFQLISLFVLSFLGIALDACTKTVAEKFGKTQNVLEIFVGKRFKFLDGLIQLQEIVTR